VRALAIIIGIGLIGIGLAVGGWLALSVGATPGKAKSSVTAVNVTGFDYSTASLSERRLWLTEQAKPMALMFDRSLPKGDGERPHMKVRGWAVDARRRAIEVQVQVNGRYNIDAESLPAAKEAMVAQVCPSYAKSPLGQNRVTLVHTFLGESGREDLSVAVNPLVCRQFM